MPDIKFTCPKCENHGIEEIMVDVTFVSKIRISEHEDDETGPGGIFTNRFDYGEQTNEDGHVDRYQCSSCGFNILDDSPENEKYTQDGLDPGALATRIKELNAALAVTPLDGQTMSHIELVELVKDRLEELSGEDMRDLVNNLFQEQITYEGDSFYHWTGTEKND